MLSNHSIPRTSEMIFAAIIHHLSPTSNLTVLYNILVVYVASKKSCTSSFHIYGLRSEEIQSYSHLRITQSSKPEVLLSFLLLRQCLQVCVTFGLVLSTKDITENVRCLYFILRCVFFIILCGCLKLISLNPSLLLRLYLEINFVSWSVLLCVFSWILVYIPCRMWWNIENRNPPLEINACNRNLIISNNCLVRLA